MNPLARATNRPPFLCVLAVLGLACSAGPKARVPESMDVAAPQPLILSAVAPGGDATPAAVRGAPQVLQLEVSQIDNPSRQAFAVAVFLIVPAGTGADGGALVPVGAVAPYPPDQPGRLTLLLPAAAQAAVAASQTPPRFRLVLQSVATDRPLVAPLQATVTLPALGPG